MHRRLTVILTLIVLALPWPWRMAAAQSVDFGQYHALVIGNNAYRSLTPLNTAIADARAVAALLRERYGHRVRLLTDATRAQMVTAINELRAELGEEDNLLIYYAGHGLLDRQSGEGFWLPVDAAEDNEANWFAISTLTRNLKAMAARHVIVVADSCYSGTLTRDAGAELATAAKRQAWLARAAAQRSRTALVSGGLEPVQDGGGGRHSVFAKAFLTALQDNRDVIEGQGLFARLRGPVVVEARQTPAYSDIRFTGHEGGDYLFVPTDIAALSTPSLAAPSANSDALAVELAYWDAVKDSGSEAALGSYLERWPAGNFAPLARLKLEALESAAATSKPSADPPRPSPPEQAASEPEQQVAAVAPSSGVARFDGRWRGATDYCLPYFSRGVTYEQTAAFELSVSGGKIEGDMNAIGPPEDRYGSISGTLDATAGMARTLPNSHGERVAVTIDESGNGLRLVLDHCSVRLARAE